MEGRNQARDRVSEVDTLGALPLFKDDALEASGPLDSSLSVSPTRKTLTSTGGARISTLQVNQSNNLGLKPSVIVKEESGLGFGDLGGDDNLTGLKEIDTGVVKEEPFLEAENTNLVIVKEEKVEVNGEILEVKETEIGVIKEEPFVETEGKSLVIVKEEKVEEVNEENTVVKETETGGINEEPFMETESKSLVIVKEEKVEVVNEETIEVKEIEAGVVNEEPFMETESKSLVIVKEEKVGVVNEETMEVKESETGVINEEPFMESEGKSLVIVKEEKVEEVKEVINACPLSARKLLDDEEVKEVINARPLSARKLSDDECSMMSQSSCNNMNKKPKMGKVEEKSLSSVVIEDGDFPEDTDWLLVGRSVVTGLSTTRGRKLVNNEIVHFAFPNAGAGRTKTSTHFMSSKAAHAASSIVRFSTKRYGEIGRLPMEWAKCLVPLVNSSKVKVLGRCVAAPVDLQLMQEIMLYASFYIHHSVFSKGDISSWKLEPSNIDSTIYPLLMLFKLLKVNPSHKAEFTPEELDSRKRSLKLDDDLGLSALPLAKRRNGCQLQEHDKSEQAISESCLNKIVGAIDTYNLEEMEPPETLACDLRPYQKQALYWMSELESGADLEETQKILHPCWAAYRVCDVRAPAIYVNVFSGEATTELPTATQMSRGGILADAMGLGKTVMTIALILARRGRGIEENQQVDLEHEANTQNTRKNSQGTIEASRKHKGGTLIVCPMALLSQWKDELEAHSQKDSISVFVHYGGDRSNDPKVIAEPDVVLTTYGVLTAAYKSDCVNSIFHRVEWHRVVLDEAHTIKASKTQAAQAAFALTSYCRWCLTGTPIQNNLEDLYSLLRFLHVEPWCNWAWWNKMIQKPYENGDHRGLKLVKAILRPLMLRRTKESKDKEGRAILVLPPTDIQVIECEQSEAENDFYSALFKRSKVQFDQFVAQGKVLHNYANILELLLRLRQCCNHPFLVMSRGDTEKYADLNKLANRFLQSNPDNTSTPQVGISRAYVEEVVEGIRNGQSTECPICLESADDPILTPCAHMMCRECLLTSWQSPALGLCPICRQLIRKNELITCPTGSRFRIDIEKNWKESSKILKLLECLEGVQKSGREEKCIVFSQWTSFLDLLEIPLKRRGYGFLRFDGKLSQKQRERVLHEFAATKDKTVMLMSLKTGGVGLNLTAASHVFLMDPWWNPAVEEQAIMRIHRIGQKRTVHVRRFIVKDTVEERMQQVQARKQRMIAGALTDEEVRSTRLEELKMLFR